MQQVNGISMFSLRDLEDQLPVSYWGIRNYIRDGRLKAVKIGRAYWVSEQNLADFLNGSGETVNTVQVVPKERQTATQGASPC